MLLRAFFLSLFSLLGVASGSTGVGTGAGAASLAATFLVLFGLGSSAAVSALASFLRLLLAVPLTAVKAPPSALTGDEAAGGGEDTGAADAFFLLPLAAERGVFAGGGVGSFGGATSASLSESLSDESESESLSEAVTASAFASGSAISTSSSAAGVSSGPPPLAWYAFRSSLYLSFSFSYLFL